MSRLDNDKLINADLVHTARASFSVIDALQDYPKEIQVLAAASVFKLLTEAHGLSPQDPMTMVGNIIERGEKQGKTQFKAIAAYLKEELGIS